MSRSRAVRYAPEFRQKLIELVAGAVKIGKTGQEYTALHGHLDCGDECLSVMLTRGLA